MRWRRIRRRPSSGAPRPGGRGRLRPHGLRPRQVRLAARLRRRRPRDPGGPRPARRGLRRALRRRHHRRARRDHGCVPLRRARARRPVSALHRRRRLPRRLRAGRHRWPPRCARRQLPRLVADHGAGDHGQPRSTRPRPPAHRQLLHGGSRDRPALRPRDVPVRQPARLQRRAHAHPRAPVLGRRHRARPPSDSTCTSRSPTSRLVQLAATGHCPNLSAPDELADAIRAFLR